jgi:hypothetical protein
MNGGTYSEALKVGFTPEQAGFLGRMSGETREEAIEAIMKKGIEAEHAHKRARDEWIMKWADRGYRVCGYVGLFAVAFCVGKAFA